MAPGLERSAPFLQRLKAFLDEPHRALADGAATPPVPVAALPPASIWR